MIKSKPFLIHNFFIPYVFEVKKSIPCCFLKQTCPIDLENPGQHPVLQVLGGTDDCVLSILVISSLFTFSRSQNPFPLFFKATIFEWPRKSRSTSGLGGTQGYWWLGLTVFRNFSIPNIFGVKKPIPRCFSKLLCPSDPKNLGKLPVSEVFKGTDDWVLRIFVISPFLTFSGSRNPFLDVSRSYHVWVTPKIQVNFRFYRCSRVLSIRSYGFS